MHIRTAIIAIICLFAAGSVPAGELSSLRVDLDGDGKAEIIKVSTFPTPEAGRSRAAVTIGTAKYSAEFFSAELDVPELRVVALDRERRQRQLLLTTQEPAWCIHHLLSYVGHKLIPLLKFNSGPTCQAPLTSGGEVRVTTWQGFWDKEDRYFLNLEGTALVAVKDNKFSLSASGAAAKTFQLQGAECPAKSVLPNAYVRVTLYDAESRSYRVETSDGGCGWLPAVDVDTSDGLIKELPWAG